MKVSILVPVYNASPFIERCVCSLFNQTYADIEFIFIDDCSRDDSIKKLENIISQYPQRQHSISIHKNKKNCGIAHVRNQLLSLASGDYIYFVDSDDYISSDAISTFVRIAKERQADIIRSRYFEERLIENDKSLNQSTTICRKIISNNSWTDKKSLLADTVRGSHTVDAVWKLFIRHSLFTEYDISFTEGINVCEDYIMSVKLFYYANHIVDIAEAPYYYCTTSNLHSMTKNTPAIIADRDKALDEVVTFLKSKGIYERLLDSVNQRILLCKQGYLLNKQHFDINRYQAFHPESNRAWRLLKYGRREQLLFWLAEHKLNGLLRFINFIRSSF